MVLVPSVCGANYANQADDVGGNIATTFPDMDKAVIKEGAFPTLDHLRNMAPGLTKNQVYDLLGRPHFREGVFGVREWNYIFHFRVNGQIETCQYQVKFDADKRTQSTHWAPAGCAAVLAEREAPVAPVAAKAPTRINLSGDALFAYSKSGQKDILEDGRAQLVAIAAQLRAASTTNIQVVGYTDRIGSDSANLALSQRRAETVREFLVRSGIAADSIVARGAGESHPVTQCPDSLGKQELVACLQPDRRVELVVSASH
jgi:outer membrane protein OmpA-like peptidoglycan-associated protein